jgi:lipopolysaccharide transport system permease protein
MRLLPVPEKRWLMTSRVTTITADGDQGVVQTLRSLWEYRALLVALAKRDVSVKFKQAAVGFFWVLIQPLVSTAIFSIIFGVFARFEAGETPYPFFVLSGMILWQYFARSVTEGAGSFVANAHLLTKVYFPRVILPVVPTLAAAVDFLLASIMMVALLVIAGTGIAWTVILIPVVGLAAALMAFGISMILAPINALYRDVGIALPFLIQTLLFLTPVAYPPNVIPERFAWLLDFHPLATLVGLMRWSVFGLPAPSVTAMAVLTGTIVLLLIVGMKVLRRLEGSLVDRI